MTHSLSIAARSMAFFHVLYHLKAAFSPYPTDTRLQQASTAGTLAAGLCSAFDGRKHVPRLFWYGRTECANVRNNGTKKMRGVEKPARALGLKRVGGKEMWSGGKGFGNRTRMKKEVEQANKIIEG